MQLAGVVVEAAGSAADDDAEEISRPNDGAGHGRLLVKAKDCFPGKICLLFNTLNALLNITILYYHN